MRRDTGELPGAAMEIDVGHSRPNDHHGSSVATLGNAETLGYGVTLGNVTPGFVGGDATAQSTIRCFGTFAGVGSQNRPHHHFNHGSSSAAGGGAAISSWPLEALPSRLQHESSPGRSRGNQTTLEEFLRGMIGLGSNPHAFTYSGGNPGISEPWLHPTMGGNLPAGNVFAPGILQNRLDVSGAGESANPLVQQSAQERPLVGDKAEAEAVVHARDRPGRVTGILNVTDLPPVIGSPHVAGSPHVTVSPRVTRSPQVTGSGSPSVTGSGPPRVTSSPHFVGSPAIPRSPMSPMGGSAGLSRSMPWLPGSEIAAAARAPGSSPGVSGSPIAGSAGLSRSMPRLPGSDMATAAGATGSRRARSFPGQSCTPASMLGLEEEAFVQGLLRFDPSDGNTADASNVGPRSTGVVQAHHPSGLHQQPENETNEQDWRPRTRTRFDAEAMERGAIKPRSMRERRRRDKISEGLQQLRRTLRAGAGGPQIDTAAMIDAAISHITNLQSQINNMENVLVVQSMLEQRHSQQHAGSN